MGEREDLFLRMDLMKKRKHGNENERKEPKYNKKAKYIKMLFDNQLINDYLLNSIKSCKKNLSFATTKITKQGLYHNNMIGELEKTLKKGRKIKIYFNPILKCFDEEDEDLHDGEQDGVDVLEEKLNSHPNFKLKSCYKIRERFMIIDKKIVAVSTFDWYQIFHYF